MEMVLDCFDKAVRAYEAEEARAAGHELDANTRERAFSHA